MRIIANLHLTFDFPYVKLKGVVTEDGHMGV